jgi:hypothetical protein
MEVFEKMNREMKSKHRTFSKDLSANIVLYFLYSPSDKNKSIFLDKRDVVRQAISSNAYPGGAKFLISDELKRMSRAGIGNEE